MLILVLTMGLPAGAQNVSTSRYDNARSGANRLETTLTPRNVNVRHFGKIFTLKVDGDIYAQPLFLTRLDIPGKGRHDVLFVATEHDSIHAFDAYGHPASPLWRLTLARAYSVSCACGIGSGANSPWRTGVPYRPKHYQYWQSLPVVVQ